MVLPEDSNNPIVDALREITESLDRSTATLNRIADHYDKIVPVMKKNQDIVYEKPIPSKTLQKPKKKGFFDKLISSEEGEVRGGPPKGAIKR